MLILLLLLYLIINFEKVSGNTWNELWFYACIGLQSHFIHSHSQSFIESQSLVVFLFCDSSVYVVI